MTKNALLILCFVLLLGLLGWNTYLLNDLAKLKESKKDLELKNQMLEGDNDVLTYDLVTCRDSLRILDEAIHIK